MANTSADRETWPRCQDSRDYLKKHKVLDLFNNLTSQLIYARPENPKQYLIERLELLNTAKSANIDPPCLFDESNITSVFGMLDPTGRGSITLRQYREALQTLGIDHFDQHPAGGDVDKIQLETFVREAKHGLARVSATYAEKKM
ncbi:EF-hand calcium-binding domain-containing protein 10-like [Lineus longissimus]|uniref:EF-hand calcium-binding domain-containing protein 10-like n=1 Tax=Lineus longissimus TaxID=88925 RepID=UPI002B4F2457